MSSLLNSVPNANANINLIAKHILRILGPGEYTLLGGAAMHVHGLLDHYPNDIDVWCEGKGLVECPGDLVDATSDKCIWGQFKIGDIHESDMIYKDTASGITLRVISLETLFITKADAGREKDIAHLPNIAKLTNPLAIIKRAEQLSRFNREHHWSLVAENLLLEIQAQYMVPIAAKWVEYIGLNKQQREYLLDALSLDNDSPDEDFSLNVSKTMPVLGDKILNPANISDVNIIRTKQKLGAMR